MPSVIGLLMASPASLRILSVSIVTMLALSTGMPASLVTFLREVCIRDLLLREPFLTTLILMDKVGRLQSRTLDGSAGVRAAILPSSLNVWRFGEAEAASSNLGVPKSIRPSSRAWFQAQVSLNGPDGRGNHIDHDLYLAAFPSQAWLFVA